MNKIKQLLLAVFTALLILTLLRVTLFISYKSVFDSLTMYETFLSFLMGLRIDIISLATFMSLAILISQTSFKFTYSLKFNKIIGLLWGAVLSLMLFVQVFDIIYFSKLSRHMGNEALLIGDDLDIILDLIINVYLLEFIALIIGIFAIFFIYQKIFSIKLIYKKNTIIFSIFYTFLILLLLVVSIRSKVKGKPFGISDSFVVNKTASANLAISGFFSVYKTINNKESIKVFMPTNQALDITKTYLGGSTTFTNKEYPLQRKFTTKGVIKTKPNVVIILLESWSSKYVDSFGNNNLGVTKNFDAIAKDGIKFTNFYANGQRSIEGITSLFTGIFIPHGFHYLGKGLELSNLSYLGTLAKQNGYKTVAMQSSKRRSFRIDAISHLAGFNEYYGAEDIGFSGDEDKDKKPKFGVWDGDLYKFLLKKLNKTKEPFLSFAFTSTTHEPFTSPNKKWNKYPHNKKDINGFLNTLNYSDAMLGKFMKHAKKQSWFDNTIFIFLADHTIGFGDDSRLFKNTKHTIKKKELDNFKIPLLVYAPKLLKSGTNNTLSSQTDIIPTLVDLLGWKNNFATLSNSIFDKKVEKRFTIMREGNLLVLNTDDGYIKYNFKDIVEKNQNKLSKKDIEALYQSLTQLLKQNKWMSVK